MISTESIEMQYLLTSTPPSADYLAAAPVSHETLLQQIRLVPGGGRHLTVDVRVEAGTVTLRGKVASFYAKQLLYHVCRKWAPGLRVIDATVVAQHGEARRA